MALAAEFGAHGGNGLIVGIVLAVMTFWLFAETTLNVAPEMRHDLRIAESVSTARLNNFDRWFSIDHHHRVGRRSERGADDVDAPRLMIVKPTE